PKSFSFKKALSGGVPARGRPKKSATVSEGPAPGKGAGLPEEKRLLLEALHEAGYHKGHAAKALGISRRYLYTQLLRHQVPVNRIEMKAYIQEHLGIS
ncbi:MAG: helix-turn-helix domain-containing protein, partial [bacterium]|nr:helix-turn-helix domain-containing protein [bacterium]